MDLQLRVVGIVYSDIKELNGPAKMEDEPDAVQARIEIKPEYEEALSCLEPGAKIELFTWLHHARRDVFTVHPRGDKTRPKRGSFATRSPWRPNPIGLHRVTVVERPTPLSLIVDRLEVIDSTPVIDIKPIPGSTKK